MCDTCLTGFDSACKTVIDTIDNRIAKLEAWLQENTDTHTSNLAHIVHCKHIRLEELRAVKMEALGHI